MHRITFENIALTLTADSAEEAYTLLDRALRTSPLAEAQPLLSTDTYEEWGETVTARADWDYTLLRRGHTSDLY